MVSFLPFEVLHNHTQMYFNQVVSYSQLLIHLFIHIDFLLTFGRVPQILTKELLSVGYSLFLILFLPLVYQIKLAFVPVMAPMQDP